MLIELVRERPVGRSNAGEGRWLSRLQQEREEENSLHGE